MPEAFKYLNVVHDNTQKPVEQKKLYEVIEWNYSSTGKSLILPLHGASPETAAQRFLFDNQRDFMVYVRRYLPEFKYDRYKDIPMTRNPAIQAQLKLEHDGVNIRCCFE